MAPVPLQVPVKFCFSRNTSCRWSWSSGPLLQFHWKQHFPLQSTSPPPRKLGCCFQAVSQQKVSHGDIFSTLEVVFILMQFKKCCHCSETLSKALSQGDAQMSGQYLLSSLSSSHPPHPFSWRSKRGDRAVSGHPVCTSSPTLPSL